MDILTLDFETFYDKDYSLSKITTEEYIRDPRFEAIGVSVKLNDEPSEWFSGTKAATKRWLQQWDWDNSIVVAHNAMFDMAILNWHFDIRPKMIGDTLSMLRAIDGPDAGNSLAKAAERYGLGVKGTEVVDALGKRRVDFSPEALSRYGAYCCNDGDITYQLFATLAPLMPKLEMRLIDRTIRMFSEPALHLDKEVLVNHLTSVREKKAALMARVEADKSVLMSNPQLAKLLEKFGVEPPMKTSPTTGKLTWAFGKNDEGFKALLDHHKPAVQAVVAARLGVKSTLEETRTERLIGVADRGLLPIPLRYYAAHTGRWGGDDKVNMQNLPRKSPLKKAIKAPPGYVFIDCDSSQIEARILAWLSGQDDLVQAFAKGDDVYKIMASAIYGVPISEVTDSQRFVGKTTILGCGYGMGAAKFRAQLKTFNVTLDMEVCQYIIEVYRRTYPKIMSLWRQAADALEALVTQRSAPLGLDGVLNVDLLGIRLPNGMYIRYDNLRKEQNPKDMRDELLYDTKKGRAVVPTRIYGGKCLAADTEVLTERGWVPIIGVRPNERVWDGVEWVRHGGLTYQGKKATTVLNGVRMTPDHQVLTNKGWRCASTCEGLYRADFRMPDGSGVRGEQRSPFSLAVSVPVRQPYQAGGDRRGEVRPQRRNSLMRVYGWGKKQIARYVEASSLRRMALNEGSLPAAHASGMAQLRRSGYYGMSKMEGFLRGLLGGYGSYVYAGAYARPEGQQPWVYPGELPVGTSNGAGSEYSGGATCRHEQGGDADRCTSLDAVVSVAPEPVYDLRNVGPRSRFVVRGDSGPFIVHNCVENVCQALARIVIGEQLLMVSRRYKVVMTVHDAIGIIAREEEAEEARAFVEACMRTRPKWGVDLPLNCESKIGASYGG